MARVRIRYYITRPRADGTLRRYWSPTPELQACGWQMEALDDDESAAEARARELNAALDLWRAGRRAAGNNAVPADAAPGTDAATVIPAANRFVTRSDNQPPAAQQRTANPVRATQLQARPQQADVAWLIGDIQRTPKWTAAPGSSIRPLAANTRRQYLWAFGIIQAWAGDGRLPVRAINSAPRVQKLYEALLAESHSKANAVIVVVRLLLEHARRRGLIKVNHAMRPGLIGLPPRLRIWSHEELTCLLAHADALGWPSVGDALLTAMDLGQREGDILALHRLRLSDGVFYLQQQKTGARVTVPATPRLRARLAAAVARIDAAATANSRPAPPWLILCESTGTRWQPDHFRRLFARIRAAAAGERIKVSRKPGIETMNDADLLATGHLPKCASLLGLPEANGQPALPAANFQDGRDTAVTNMAEGGATIPEICAVTGHTEKSAYNILKHYLALNGAMAHNAIAKLVALYERQDAARKRAAATDEGEA